MYNVLGLGVTSFTERAEISKGTLISNHRLSGESGKVLRKIEDTFNVSFSSHPTVYNLFFSPFNSTDSLGLLKPILFPLLEKPFLKTRSYSFDWFSPSLFPHFTGFN